MACEIHPVDRNAEEQLLGRRQAKKESAVQTYGEATQPLAVFDQCSVELTGRNALKNPRSPVMPPSECVSGVLASELDG